MKRISYILTLVLLVFGYSCKEEGRLDHLDDNAPAPAQVSDVQVTNYPGGARLKYKLPNDNNLLYIKAEYEIRPDVSYQTKSSYYADTLKVEGFGVSKEYKVRLYSVGRNEKVSEPVVVTITPETPPVELAFPELKLNSAFGGVRINFKNELEANLALVLMADTTGTGLWYELQTFYTKSPEGYFVYKGLDTVPANFAVYLRDRWNNKSDTLKETLTPLFEQEIPKPFTAYNLSSDTYQPVQGLATYGINSLWDNITSNVNGNIFATAHTSPIPQTFTINVDNNVILSGIRVHQRKSYEYTGSNVRVFELWGSNKANPSDDLFNGDWVILGRFQSWKPSGSGGAVTAEDKEYANVTGELFELSPFDENPNPWVPVKYIRFRTLETYKGPSTAGQITIAEISLYGQIIKK